MGNSSSSDCELVYIRFEVDSATAFDDKGCILSIDDNAEFIDLETCDNIIV